MNIKQKFLELTSRTYPHGTEQELFHLLGDGLGAGLTEDEFGNLFIKIGESDVMFTSHLDTATAVLSNVIHVFDGKIIKTDGKSILGADDKAGVTIMLHMIENKVPGLYYFFLGEEVGCVGSRKVSSKYKEEKIEGINKVIAFDRRDNSSIITHQGSQRTASDKFGEALAKALNDVDDTFTYKNDDTGICTDSIQFVRIYSECTNISVGYKNEHTYSESQDIEHLDKLAKACIKVDWNSLPTERDPSVTEYKSFSYGGYGGYGGYGMNDEWDDEYVGRHRSPNTSTWGSSTFNTVPKKNKKVYLHDESFNHVSCLEYKEDTNTLVSVDLDPMRVKYEKLIIDDLLKSLELNFTTSKWDGFMLYVYYTTGNSSDCDRNDLLEYLPELDYNKLETIAKI